MKLVQHVTFRLGQQSREIAQQAYRCLALVGLGYAGIAACTVDFGPGDWLSVKRP